ncbi:rod shape-determining protein MreD [Palleronia salina]|uniref:Rod shape-determining protein MreD n=1 Tax=Palleronia salina TaxID=313368 RepID=A0A1M6GCH4_9RHOB|nr:hypothetical protein [Palleronia salina]SHJ07610.1 rod shape-determining protein MreD [Palleronia salina]
MVDPLTLRIWGFRLYFTALSAAILFVHILPFHISASAFVGPDLLVCLAFAWVLRRPDYVPVLLVAAVIAVSDILFLRPLGLWTALVLLGMEFLRPRGHLSAEMPFPVEWAMVTGTIFAISLLNALILAIVMVPQPPLTGVIVHAFVTAAVYPVVVAISAFVIGVRPPGPAERDSRGIRA